MLRARACMVRSQLREAESCTGACLIGSNPWHTATLCRSPGPGLLPFSCPESNAQRHELAKRMKATSGTRAPQMELPCMTIWSDMAVHPRHQEKERAAGGNGHAEIHKCTPERERERLRMETCSCSCHGTQKER